jgi:hypothetical protein
VPKLRIKAALLWVWRYPEKLLGKIWTEIMMMVVRCSGLLFLCLADNNQAAKQLLTGILLISVLISEILQNMHEKCDMIVSDTVDYLLIS